MFFLKTNSHNCDKMRGEMQVKEQMKEITTKVMFILGAVMVTYPFLIALFLWVMVK